MVFKTYKSRLIALLSIHMIILFDACKTHLIALHSNFESSLNINLQKKGR